MWILFALLAAVAGAVLTILTKAGLKSVDAWIDSNRLMRKITSLGRFVFMTDGAIGRREEPNLRHVTINVGKEADRSRIVPILTTKHSLEYCLEFAQRSYTLGFRSLVTEFAPTAVFL